MRFLQLFTGALGKSPRPTRLHALLRSLGEVTVCAAAAPAMEPPHAFLPLPARRSLPQKVVRACGLLGRRYEADIWSAPMRALSARLKGQNFSAIVCHDALLVPLALAVRDARPDRSRPCPVLLDAREFYPRQFEQALAWQLLLGGLNDYVCRTYFPRVDHIFTVSPGLAEGYRREYGLTCEVLPSYSPHQDISVPETGGGDIIRCIHHGGAVAARNLEGMIEAFALLEGKATLDFMLVPTSRQYYEALQQRTAAYPHINFIDTVPMPQIVSHISSYDMGVYLLNDGSFNHRHCLPNKFFEYVQARLALAISPLPDMSALLRRYDLGVVAEDFTPRAFADAIGKLTREDIVRYKRNADKAAQELCWEKNDARLREVILELIGASAKAVTPGN